MPEKKRKPRKPSKTVDPSQQSPERSPGRQVEIHQPPDNVQGARPKTTMSPMGTHDSDNAAAKDNQPDPQQNETPKKGRKTR